MTYYHLSRSAGEIQGAKRAARACPSSFSPGGLNDGALPTHRRCALAGCARGHAVNVNQAALGSTISLTNCCKIGSVVNKLPRPRAPFERALHFRTTPNAFVGDILKVVSE
jgi:hypothetical protein